MKKLLWAMLLCAAFNSNAQVFWTETFSNSCTSGCHADTYVGANGAWTVASTGANLSSSNIWFVSAIECGNAAGQCGTSCGSSDPSLHVGANIVPFLVDPGAAYYANIESFWRAESPTINCSGKSNISVSFNYMMEGQPGADFAAVAYYDGTTWYYYNGSSWTTTFTSISITNNASCSPQGLWTAYSVPLPASANNNPSVKIGFRWVNDNDGVGTDPSFAVDDINISSSAPTCSVSINPIFPAILCYGDCNSALGATATGTGPITYSWNTIPVQTTSAALNLCAGTYTVTITDSTNCVSTASMTITQPPQLTMGAPVITNPSCIGCFDASICVGVISGGTFPYSYSLNPALGPFNGICWQNLPAGIYTICVTDANGCTSCVTDTLVDPPSGILNNFSSEEIILTPNIISTSAVLSVPFIAQEFLFTIYDCFGKKVREKTFSEKEMTIEKGNLPQGIYFFKLTTNQKRFYRGKFVVE
jgi:hypothetical protein